MKINKYDPRQKENSDKQRIVYKKVLSFFEETSKEFGMVIVKYTFRQVVNLYTDKEKLLRKRAELQKQLKEVNSKL